MRAAAIGQPRPPLAQMSAQERRDYLATLDAASRRQAEAIYAGPVPVRAVGS